MSREDIVAVAARMFAVYLALNTLVYFGYIFSAPPTHSPVEWLAPTILSVCLLLSVLLWFFPLSVARKLLPVMKEPRSEAGIDAEVALSLGLALIGVWFATAAVRPLVLALLTFTINRGLDAEPDHHSAIQVVVYLLQLSIGLGLAIGSRGLRDLLLRARKRYPPMAPASDPTAED